MQAVRTRGEIDLVALLVAFVSWARPTVYRPHLALQDRDENKDNERRQRHLLCAQPVTDGAIVNVHSKFVTNHCRDDKRDQVCGGVVDASQVQK